ncbi:hypothetical protein OG562_25820 [Streptomyces sp. NBC_01275]|uniref:hypothetical protein n=1 Tax=Streptomyces sp. NBC_01275 TaxID=2903807 RepID=UPI002254586C|nr:hypothetical protein [Streptomyces sp. NBC_01275]MCX4764316.1 hypothetical protein [Streptomyces sp. NBC_01275]
MNLRSSWVAETGQTREDTRLTQMGATTPANPLEVRSGILPGSYDGQYRLSGFWMEGGAGRMTATVHEGRAVIQAEGNQGAYPVTLPEPTTLTFTDGQSNPRIDVVVLRIYDNPYDASGFTKAALEIIQGAPDANPQVPTLPPIALPIYQVRVRAGASAGSGGVNWNDDVTDLRTPTVAVGGILPAYGETGNGAYPGQYRDSGGALQRWDGSAWVGYPSALGGIAPAGAVATASYTGQYRDSGTGLQRWNGTAWVNYQPVPAWTDYTPVWGAESGTAPSIGNGTLAGSYVKTGTVVHVRIYLKIGSTTNLSAQASGGAWTFSLPVAPTSVAWKLDGRVMSVEAFDSSTPVLLYQGSGLLAATGTGVVRSLRDTLKTSATAWDKTLPFTWATGDILSIHGTYESAS